MTDQQIRNLAYAAGMVTKWNRPGFGPDFHDYIFTFARALLATQELTANPVDAQKPANVDDKTALHAAIMNIPADTSRCGIAGVNGSLAYKQGHKDARHAAAELVVAQLAAPADEAPKGRTMKIPPDTLIARLRSTSAARSWADADQLMEAAANRIEDLEAQLSASVAAQEPTPEMIEAGARYGVDGDFDADFSNGVKERCRRFSAGIYRAMLAARPAQGERQPEPLQRDICNDCPSAYDCRYKSRCKLTGKAMRNLLHY